MGVKCTSPFHPSTPNAHANNPSTQTFAAVVGKVTAKRVLHTARRQTCMPTNNQHRIVVSLFGTATLNTHMPTRHERKIFEPCWRTPGTHQSRTFADPIGKATPSATHTQHTAKPACKQDISAVFLNTLLALLMYTQHAAIPACQQYIKANFPHLLVAPPPQTPLTHSPLPNPHATNTSTTIIAASIGTAQTLFTHSTQPKPHARITSVEYSHSSHCHGFANHIGTANVHTACRHTLMAARHQGK